jgi:DNA-binding response OmpR family regulator
MANSSNRTVATEMSAGLVLVANDHEWTARSVETILVAAGYRVVRTFTGSETLEVARSRLPDAFILDHQLPDFSGLEVCRQIREDHRFGASTPIILTTAGPSGRAQRLAAYEAGAWEFYGQPLDGQALLHKVRAYLAARREVLRVTMAGLLDPETMLYSRLGLIRRMDEMAADAQRRGVGVACVALAVGVEHHDSRLTHRVAEILSRVARSADAKGRLGPAAYAVVATTDVAGAHRLAGRLSEAMTPELPSLKVRVTVPDVASLDATALLEQAAVAVAA